MNKQNRLLICMDTFYGFESGITSEVNEVGQQFDEERNQHVITIEYRVPVLGGSQVKEVIDPEVESMREVLKRIRSMKAPCVKTGV